MSSERPQEFSDPPVSRARPSAQAEESAASENRERSDDPSHQEPSVIVRGETLGDQGQKPDDRGSSADASGHETTILIRGETVRDPAQTSPSKDSTEPKPKDATDSKESTSSKDAKDSKPKAPRKEISEAKAKIQKRLPALDDDADVGVQKEQTVVRDGKADLAFTGSLLASAAPSSAPKGKWQEYRIYETNGGKHVFSKVSRSVYAEDQDTHDAEVFDPTPASVPSQLLRSARDLTRSRPLTWMDAAVTFFGYDPLAKTLYRKLGSQFEEHIS